MVTEYHEPQISHLPDGRWWARVELSHTVGHPRRRKALYGRSPAEVRVKLNALRQTLARGQTPPDERTPLEVAMTAWLTALDPTDEDDRRIRRSTWIGYEAHLRLHIAPWIGRIPVGALTTAQVEAWLRDLRTAGRSAAMRRKALVTLRTALKWSVARGYVSHNAASLAQLPRKGRPRRWVPLDDDEMGRILHAIEEHRLRTLFRVALTLGPRMGELMGLTRDRVNLEQRTITLDGTLSWVTGYPVLEDAKTAAGMRTIRLPDSLWADLMDHLARLDAEATADRWDPDPRDFVFVRSNGRPLRGDGTGGVGDQFKRCLRRAGIPPRNFHQTRHQAASMLLRFNGNNLVEVAQVLGHSTYRHTTDLYGHLSPDAAAATTERVAQHLRRVSTGVSTGVSG